MVRRLVCVEMLTQGDMRGRRKGRREGAKEEGTEGGRWKMRQSLPSLSSIQMLHPSVYPSISPSIHQSIHPFIYLSTHLFIAMNTVARHGETFTLIAAESIVSRIRGPTHWPGFSVLLCLNDSRCSWHKQSLSDDSVLPGRVSSLSPTRCGQVS